MSKCLQGSSQMQGRSNGGSVSSATNRNMLHNDTSGLAFMRKRIQKEERQARRAEEALKNRKATPRFDDIQNRTRLRPPYYVLDIYDEEKKGEARRSKQEASSQIFKIPEEEEVALIKASSRESARSSAREDIQSSRSELDSFRSDMETSRLELKMKKLLDEKVEILQKIAQVDQALLKNKDTTEPSKAKKNYRRQGKRA